MVHDPIAQLYLGETLCGRYEICEHIKSGGFGLVFRARDHFENRDVALKILKPGLGADATQEFETEGRLLEHLRHRSHVLNLFGPASNNDAISIVKAGQSTAPVPFPVVFMVLELADACLAELVANRAALSWGARLDLFRDVVLGVHQMHLSMVMHRDIKSENVLVFLRNGSGSQACVADLGRGRNLQEPARFLADQYVAGRGDLRFAPPEMLHLAGTDDPVAFRRADLYLLGSTLFELCTGQGITGLVYGDVRAVLTAAVAIDQARRPTEYRGRMAKHRARFEPAFMLVAQEVPTHIRDATVRLLRQLCDPDPEVRERRSRIERNEPVSGINWLLRRVDVLRKLDALEHASTKRSYRKVS
jgi:serine/threonine protein kinase